MAFQQPTRKGVQRASRPINAQNRQPAALRAPTLEQQAEQSQDWVLFSPHTEVTTTTSYLTDSDHSLETPGRSRLSEIGSFNTRSEDALNARHPASIVFALDDAVAEDDAELDSLDSHLPGFRSIPDVPPSHRGSQPAEPVFPSHDGLGSFRLDFPTIDTEAQDRLYQFERFNPHKVHPVLESLGPAYLAFGDAQAPEDEKRQRIEAWRLEHSRVLLDEIQRETRRRKKSFASKHGSAGYSDGEVDDLTWHDEDAVQAKENQEGFLARITRSIVKDLLGLDDQMLSILLGEELPLESEEPWSSPQPSQPGSELILTASKEPSWQLHILEKLSRELGLLVNRLSHHPGAFTAYSQINHMPLPYAGLAVIPESNDAGLFDPETQPKGPNRPPSLAFQPTMRRHSHPPGLSCHSQPVDGYGKDTEGTDCDFTKEEWEKNLDVKLVFRYLVSRFASSPSTSAPSGASHNATPTQQDNAAKAALIRQHHPLIARTRPVERRAFKGTVPVGPAAIRRQSSCASQSTRRSARRSSCSSRHYWDIGGSIGTGSMIAPNAPLGSWGEV